MLYYIQTQDGELPYTYKVFRSVKAARAAALRFIQGNPQPGAIAVADALHGSHYAFHRGYDAPGVTEEIFGKDGEVTEVQH